MAEFNQSDDTGSRSAPGRAMAAGVLHEAAALTSAHCELLSGLEALWVDWMKRQRDALEASNRSLREMCDCRTLADIALVQQQWFADATRRGVSDIGMLASDAAALTWRVARTDRVGAPGAASPERGRTPAKSAGDAPLQRAAAE
jgi:hypothetical protein